MKSRDHFALAVKVFSHSFMFIYTLILLYEFSAYVAYGVFYSRIFYHSFVKKTQLINQFIFFSQKMCLFCDNLPASETPFLIPLSTFSSQMF